MLYDYKDFPRDEAVLLLRLASVLFRHPQYFFEHILTTLKVL
jgi:hypothetical protein